MTKEEYHKHQFSKAMHVYDKGGVQAIMGLPDGNAEGNAVGNAEGNPNPNPNPNPDPNPDPCSNEPYPPSAPL